MIGRPSPPSRLSTWDIADNSITSAKIADNVITHADVATNAITASELADDAVDIAALSATGTADNTTFLRGDNSWQIVDTEGTGIKSTGESGGSKFLREDGDGTSSWQEAGSPSITDNGNSNAMTIDSSENVTLVESLTTPSLKQNSNQNLSGTYSAHQLFIADGYTLTGNITVNEDIVLTKLSDDGTSITLTTDGNSQTITGTGSIESSTLAQTPVTSFTGMTGELNSAVTGTLGSSITGSPALNLNNATFPAGHVLNVTSRANKTQTHVTGSTYTASDCYHNITTTNGNYVWVMATCPVNVYSGSVAIDSVTMNLQIWHSTDNSSFSYMQNIQGGATTDKQHAMWSHNYSGNLDAHFSKHTVQTMQFLHGPVTGTSQYYKVYLKYTGHTGTGHAAIMNPDSNIWGGMTLMEVQA